MDCSPDLGRLRGEAAASEAGKQKARGVGAPSPPPLLHAATLSVRLSIPSLPRAPLSPLTLAPPAPPLRLPQNTMNLLLLGAVSLPVGYMAYGFGSLFVPPK